MKGQKNQPEADHIQQPVSGCASIYFLHKILEESPVPTLVLDKNRKVLIWNNACEKLTGVSASVVLGTREAWRGFYREEKKIPAELVFEEDTPELSDDGSGNRLSKAIPDKMDTEGWFPALNGKNRYLVISVSPLRSEQGELFASIATINDATEYKIYEQQLMSGIIYDPMTGLPDRNLLVDRLQQAITYAKREKELIAVFCICLTGFGSNKLDHDDDNAIQLLKTISGRLKSEIRAIDTLGYYGNGEFYIVASKFQLEEHIAVLADRIHSAVSAPVLLDDKPFDLPCNVGISAFPNDGDDDKSLLKKARAAINATGTKQEVSIRFYNDALNLRYQNQLNLEAQLKNAVKNNEFGLHFQPQASLKTGQMTGMEALLRWTNSQVGSVSPAVFIPLAERLGLIEEIGNWVLEKACKQHIEWQRKGLSPPKISINLSGHQLKDDKFVHFTKRVLEQTGINPKFLELEVTETSVVEDLISANKILSKLKGIGLSIALDDFGTGYSSLSYLRQLPIDKLKIDRSFIADVTRDPNSSEIARATIAMAHALQLCVIAEGVEVKEQITYLQRLGCDEIQGYFYSLPVPVHKLEALLRNKSALPLETAEKKESRRVLIVDDEVGIQKSLKRELALFGYDVETANNAEEGLSILAQKNIPVVISDFNMPGVSGLYFLERVKKLHPHTVRIAFSGSHNLDLLVDAINKGSIYKFLFKPWSEEQITSVLEDSFLYYRFSVATEGSSI